jgi:SsrA-binding protein
MKNRKASYDYNLITPYIAGIILEGTEVKLLQDNKVSFNGAFCYFEENELFVKN